jgi:3-oxoacyl-[acyl-carrier-protein] synthase-1
VGFGTESATLDSGLPLRADGLVAAIRGALADAGCELHDIDLRITDLSGEQYYFKEASLALTRILRQRKEEFDIWHAAECTGEVGAAAGAIALAVAEAACRKAYAPGPAILLHASNDDGERMAAVLSYGVRS